LRRPTRRAQSDAVDSCARPPDGMRRRVLHARKVSGIVAPMKPPADAPLASASVCSARIPAWPRPASSTSPRRASHQPPSAAQYAVAPSAEAACSRGRRRGRGRQQGSTQLLGPIALYPDPLLALILPASTVPEDIRAASAYLVQYADTTRIDSQPWDPSVRALAHYPAGRRMDGRQHRVDAGRRLGEFLASPAEVMQSIQRLRARALAAGALKSTPQQQVVVTGRRHRDPAGGARIDLRTGLRRRRRLSRRALLRLRRSLHRFRRRPCSRAGPWLSFCLDWQSAGRHLGWRLGRVARAGRLAPHPRPRRARPPTHGPATASGQNSSASATQSADPKNH
jgi:hypothetical protein